MQNKVAALLIKALFFCGFWGSVLETAPQRNAAEMLTSLSPARGFHWEVEFQIGSLSFN